MKKIIRNTFVVFGLVMFTAFFVSLGISQFKNYKENLGPVAQGKPSYLPEDEIALSFTDDFVISFE